MYSLIFKDEEDQTSNSVIDWFVASQKNYKVFNNDNLAVGELQISKHTVDFILINISTKIKFTDISSYWMRRGDLFLHFDDGTIPSKKLEYLKAESNMLYDAVMALIYSKHGLGRIELNETNKIYNLLLASQVELSVPISVVTSFKSVLRNQLEKGQFCTKAVRQGGYRVKNKSFTANTTLTSTEDVNKLANITWPSLLQEYQEKKYELRIFYLDGDFYTSAIFSQNDEQTKVDFRNYNQARPNRTPPYQLPKEIEKKLHKLMQKLTIKCGSIDMVVNTKNEFVFLEVNPFGQFQQVSFPCNYYLELKVAEYLTKYDKTEEAVC